METKHPPEPVYPPHPDDFCRLCGGEGMIKDVEYRPHRVEIWERCPSCKGKGYGR